MKSSSDLHEKNEDNRLLISGGNKFIIQIMRVLRLINHWDLKALNLGEKFIGQW